MPAKLKIIISISALAVFAATLLIFPETVLQGFSAIRSVFAAPTCDPSGTCSVLTTDGSGNFGIGANSDAVSRLFIKDADTSATKFGLKIVSSDGSTPVFVVRNDGAVSLASSTYVGGRLCFGTMGTGTDCVTSWSGVGGGVTSTPAGYVTPGYFNSVAGTGGNYSFPASLSVGTSTAVGGTALFVNGNTTIGVAGGDVRLGVNGSLLVSSPTGGEGYFGDGGTFGHPEFGMYNNGDGVIAGYDYDGGGYYYANGLLVSNSGKVGVGTINPQYLLDVYGTSNKLGLTYSYTDTYGSTGAELSADSSGDLHIIATRRFPSILAKNILLAENGGKVGIATTTPTYPLTVAGTIHSSTGGYRFPDGTTQTTAATAGTNYFTLSGSSLYPTSTAYNVGIGTSTPAYKLSVAGKVNADSQAGAGGYISSGNHGGTGSASWHPSGIYSAGTNWLYGTVVFNGAVSGATSISAGSFTGAGTGLTGTAASLTAGVANSVAWANVTGKPTMVDLAGTNTWTGINYFKVTAGSGTYLRNGGGSPLEPFSDDGGAAYMSFHRGGAYAVNVGLDPDGSFAIGGWSDGAVNRIKIETTGNTTFGSTGTAKINVGTIDPPYTINGEQYATYLSGMTGQKEETTGEIRVTCPLRQSSSEASNAQRVTCETSIDFGTQEKGSDLWLFAKTANIKNNFDKLTVLLTPAFDGKVWYEKDAQNNVLKVFAIPATSYPLQDTSFSVSYRLTAPRFDSAKWLNTRNEPGVDGFIIND